MTAEAAIEIMQNHVDTGMHWSESEEKMIESHKTCLILANECLERRHQPDIATVLEELETELVLKQVWYVPGVITGFEKIRAKYCAAPKTEEKPTLKGIESELIAAVKEIAARMPQKGLIDFDLWMDRLQNQLKEVEE
jgi:hypothetical protein